MNKNYQLGLLHFVHVLINADGSIDDREMDAIHLIQAEEEIDDAVFRDFSRSIATAKTGDIYTRGIELLNQCNEEEKLIAFVHLFRLAEADASISMNEVRHLLHAIKITQVDFTDVELSARLSSQKKTAA